MLADLNVKDQAKGRQRAPTKQLTVQAAGQLSLELKPRAGEPPIISAMQIEELPHE